MNDSKVIQIPESAYARLNQIAVASGFNGDNWASLANTDSVSGVKEEIASFLQNEISEAKLLLNDAERGIVVFDLPELDDLDTARNMWLGSLMAIVLTKLTYDVRPDSHTGMPFTIYNASSQGERLLKKNGIKYHSPEQILGFHTDGMVDGAHLASPKYVSIYNVFLGYLKTANFHWVPFARWNDFHGWQNKLVNKKFNLEITPITYKKPDDELEVISDGAYEVSVIQKNGDNSFVPFFNGEIVSCTSDPEFDMTAIKNMQTSLNRCSDRISIPIQGRRLFMVNNWLGAHARDIFEEPIENLQYSRSFFRAMSQEMLAV